jgi:hypothetical protein
MDFCPGSQAQSISLTSTLPSLVELSLEAGEIPAFELTPSLPLPIPPSRSNRKVGFILPPVGVRDVATSSNSVLTMPTPLPLFDLPVWSNFSSGFEGESVDLGCSDLDGWVGNLVDDWREDERLMQRFFFEGLLKASQDEALRLTWEPPPQNPSLGVSTV